jgi:hypothetical protein
MLRARAVRRCSIVASVAALAAAGSATVGCSSEAAPAGAGGTGGGGAGPQVEVLHPDAPTLDGADECTVTITTGIPYTAPDHPDVCTPVEYADNPPSSGDHWKAPWWAAWGVHEEVVRRELYVHNMEHGGVVLLHQCDRDDCPDVVDGLADVYDQITADPKCLERGELKRVIVSGDPLLDDPIAAATWGSTYTANCLDPDSLLDFVADVYGKSPEDTCASGKEAAEVFAACGPSSSGTGGGDGAAGAAGGVGGGTPGAGGAGGAGAG